MGSTQSDYVLGHTEREQLRLIRQAQVLAASTERFLREAGIVAGLHVLDIGCGMGDVAMLAARLVGPAGRVLAVDGDQASVETARRRAAAAGLGHMTVERADIMALGEAGPFDAIVGRLVLEFQPDPVAAVGRLCPSLRAGGVLALQEPSWNMWLAATMHLPLRTAVTALIRDVFVAAGVHTEMELPLYRGFKSANLTPPQLRLDLPVGDDPHMRGLLHDLLLAVRPRAEALGLPLDALGDPATLAARLDAELDAQKSFASFVALVGAFAHKRP